VVDIRDVWDPREVIEHKLSIEPMYKPIRQKKRRCIPVRRETIR
jgi:hypothetical protein